MKNRDKGFCVFFDWLHRLEAMEPADAFEIILAIGAYYEHGEDPVAKFTGASQVIVGMMLDQIIRAERLSEIRAINARATNEKKQSFANAERTQSNAEQRKANAERTQCDTTETETNTETIIPPIIPPSSFLTSGISGDIPPEKTKKASKSVKHKYGMYKNVLLSDEDMLKLKEEFPTDWESRIERLSEYIATKGDKYKNHLAVIRSWARRDRAEAVTTPAYSSFNAEDAMTAAMQRSYGEDPDELLKAALSRTYN